MPISPYKVKFNMGENATDSNPPIEAGQILLDKAEDKQCLFVDVDDSTRLQIKDPTKMDKWAELQTLQVGQGSITALNINYEDIPDHVLALVDGDYTNPSDLSMGIALETIRTESYKYSTAVFQLNLLTSPTNIAGVVTMSSGYQDPMHIELSRDGTGSSLLAISLNAWNDGSDHAGISLSGISPFISGLATPTSDTHAANKKYVDDQVLSVQTTWIDW